MQLKAAPTVIVTAFLIVAARPALSAELEADPGPPELDVDTGLPVGPIILGSMSLAVIAVGAGFGWQADQEFDRWKEARDSGDAAATKRLADDVDTHSIAANVLLFGGVALAATSVIWWLVSGGDDEEEPDGETSASFQVALGPGQASLTLEF